MSRKFCSHPWVGVHLAARSKETGGAIVEYAFGVTIFLSLVLGIGGFSHAVYAYHFVNNEAKEAARWAAVNGHSCGADNSCNGTAPMNNGPASSTDVNTYVKNHIPPGIDSTKIATVTCGLSDTSACAESSPLVCTKGVAISGITGSPYPNYPSCTVKVQVAYALTYIFPLLPTTTSITSPCTVAGFCLSSTAEMVIAH